MYGGYIIGTSLEPAREVAGRGVPLNVVSQPAWGIGKATTAKDLAQLHRAVWLASGVTGVGVLASHRRRGVMRGLLVRLLTEAAERCQVLASLRASETRIYQRFGFGLA